MIFDIVGDRLANVCQFQEFLLGQRVVSFFGKVSIPSAFVSKIVVPVHARLRWLEQLKTGVDEIHHEQ